MLRVSPLPLPPSLCSLSMAGLWLAVVMPLHFSNWLKCDFFLQNLPFHPSFCAPVGCNVFLPSLFSFSFVCLSGCQWLLLCLFLTFLFSDWVYMLAVSSSDWLNPYPPHWFDPSNIHQVSSFSLQFPFCSSIICFYVFFTHFGMRSAALDLCLSE